MKREGINTLCELCFKLLKGCLPQILLGPLLNTLSQVIKSFGHSHCAKLFGIVSKTCLTMRRINSFFPFKTLNYLRFSKCFLRENKLISLNSHNIWRRPVKTIRFSVVTFCHLRNEYENAGTTACKLPYSSHRCIQNPIKCLRWSCLQNI